MLNKANRELGKVKQELRIMTDNYETAQEKLNGFRKDTENEARQYEDEIDRLRKNIEELEEEHEELRSKYQVKSEIDYRVEEESTRKIMSYS